MFLNLFVHLKHSRTRHIFVCICMYNNVNPVYAYKTLSTYVRGHVVAHASEIKSIQSMYAFFATCFFGH